MIWQTRFMDDVIHWLLLDSPDFCTEERALEKQEGDEPTPSMSTQERDRWRYLSVDPSRAEQLLFDDLRVMGQLTQAEDHGIALLNRAGVQLTAVIDFLEQRSGLQVGHHVDALKHLRLALSDALDLGYSPLFDRLTQKGAGNPDNLRTRLGQELRYLSALMVEAALEGSPRRGVAEAIRMTANTLNVHKVTTPGGVKKKQFSAKLLEGWRGELAKDRAYLLARNKWKQSSLWPADRSSAERFSLRVAKWLRDRGAHKKSV